MFASLLLLSFGGHAIPVSGTIEKADIKIKEPAAEKITWHKKLSSAKTIALNEYKPMIIFFSSRGLSVEQKAGR